MHERYGIAYIRKPTATLQLPWSVLDGNARRIEIEDRSRWRDYHCDLALEERRHEVTLQLALHLRARLPTQRGHFAIEDPAYTTRFGELYCRTLPDLARAIDATLARILGRPPPVDLSDPGFRCHWHPVAAATILPVRVLARQLLDRHRYPEIRIKELADTLIAHRTPAYDSIRVYTSR